MLREPPFEDAVTRLDVTVLFLLADPDGARFHAEVGHHRAVLVVEPALAGAEGMGGRRRIVSLVKRGHAAEPEQRRLHAAAQRRHRLRVTYRGPFPVRVRQHAVTELVREGLAADGYPERRRMREVGLHRLAGPMRLREEDLALRSS